MFRILISQKINSEGLEVFGNDYEILIPDGFTQQNFDNLAINEADAIILRTNLRVCYDVIQKAKKLKVISRTGAGVDNIDLEAASAAGIIVCNLPALNNKAVAEHTVTMMMASAKHLPMLDAGVRKDLWTDTRNKNAPLELHGKTLGVIGMGSIGSEVAKICHLGLDMKILAYDPYADDSKFEGYRKTSDLIQVARESDFVTLHVPGMTATDGMIGTEFFSAMKTDAILINCSRGSIVDETALLSALENGKIAGAALDVFKKEPLPSDHPFCRMDNIILSPHAAALTKETTVRAAVEACRQAKDVLEGRMPSNVIKKKI